MSCMQNIRCSTFAASWSGFLCSYYHYYYYYSCIWMIERKHRSTYFVVCFVLLLYFQLMITYPYKILVRHFRRRSHLCHHNICPMVSTLWARGMRIPIHYNIAPVLLLIQTKWTATIKLSAVVYPSEKLLYVHYILAIIFFHNARIDIIYFEHCIYLFNFFARDIDVSVSWHRDACE